LGKDIPQCPAGPVAQAPITKSCCDRTNDVPVYQGVGEASPNSKITVNRCLLEQRLGKEVTDTLVGSGNYQRIIPATDSVYFRPVSPPSVLSSDDDLGMLVCLNPKAGVLKYFDADGEPY
jgi:hypothetical protein